MNEYVCVCFNICKMHKREKIYGNTSSNKMGVRKGGFWLWLVARLSWRQTDLHAATAFCPSRKVTHTNQLRRTTFGTCLNNNPSTWTPFHISIILFFFFSLFLFLSFTLFHTTRQSTTRKASWNNCKTRLLCVNYPSLLLQLLPFTITTTHTHINTEQIN